jgi:RNAse (barnase) inhibitor barstar
MTRRKMPELILDAKDWTTETSFYDGFFEAVGAPPWHGRNFDAVNDSVCHGRINQIETPYCLVIRNYDHLNPSAKAGTDKFISFIRSLKERGCRVDVRVE